MSIQMKIFTMNNVEGVPFAGGGYIMGEGKLPDNFNPDEFMSQFSGALMRRIMTAQMRGQPIPEAIQQLIHERLQAQLDTSIAEAPVVELEHLPSTPDFTERLITQQEYIEQETDPEALNPYGLRPDQVK
jgi:hypothetical protein